MDDDSTAPPHHMTNKEQTQTNKQTTQGLPGTTFNMASLSDVGILKNNLSARKFQLKVRGNI